MLHAGDDAVEDRVVLGGYGSRGGAARAVFGRRDGVAERCDEVHYAVPRPRGL